MDHLKRLGDDCADLSIGKWKGKIISEYKNSELASLFSSDTFPSPDFPGNIENIHSNVGQTFKITISDGSSFFVKYFESRKPKDAIKSFFIPMEAARSWKAAGILFKAGISAPLRVAAMEQKILGMNSKTVFIAQAITNAQSKNLRTYFQEAYEHKHLPIEKIQEKRRLITMLGDFYRDVHQKKVIYFPDFHPHNFVLEKTKNNNFKLYIVDFDEVNFKIRKDDIIKNLSSLCRNTDKNQNKSKYPYITTCDRLRFIKAYLGQGNNGRAASQKLLKEIINNYLLK